MSVDPEIKFSLVRKGYDPKEVDDAFDEMQREIEALRRENRQYLDAIKKYNTVLQKVAASTKQLEETRAQERRRLEALRNRSAGYSNEN